MDEERFSRLERLLGSDALERLHSAHVMIVGIGAVGGWAMEALVRSGVGHLRLVDFDVVEASNMNRQVIATVDTLGMKKVDAARDRCLTIWPGCDVQALDVFVDDENASSLVEGVDIVLDCNDTVMAKVALIRACQEKDVTIISSMGAALRRDLTRIRVSSLAQTHGCPLARAVRAQARRQGLSLDVSVVFSDETVDFDYSGSRIDTDDERRKHTALGSLTTVTAVRVSPDFGYAKIYVSVFPFERADAILAALREHAPRIRMALGRRVRNQLRSVPEIEFFIDDSLEYIENIDNLLKR